MKISKWISLILVLMILPCVDSEAQVLKRLKKTVEKEAENAANRKAKQKTREAVNKTIDGQPQKDSTQTNQGGSVPHNGDLSSTGNSTRAEGGNKSFESYSKFDFIPGEKVVHFDNFERSEIGDFPSGWNTLGSAEVVTTNSAEGKWLKISNNTGGLIPYDMVDFPENFTLEMDFIFDYPLEEYAYQRDLSLIFTTNEDPEDKVNSFRSATNLVYFTIKGGLRHSPHTQFYKLKDGKSSAGTKPQIPQIINDNTRGKPIHVSLWRQGRRFRMYVENEKLYDVPLAWSSSETIKAFRIIGQLSEETSNYYISNIRLAVGKPDTRSKLITEGRMVTYGITFNSDSDIVKPQSYGTLKQIAQVLNDNPDVKIQIVGHTDGDGESAYNLSLSERRAAAVKHTLSSQFKVSSERMLTIGKGESQPIGDNNTSEGKAQNRRVELIKM